MAIFDIKRGNTIIASVKARGSQNRSLMVEDRLVMDFKSPYSITFRKGDTVQAFGTTYKLNQPNLIRRSTDVDGFSYSIEFEAVYYDLGKWYLNTLDQNNNLTQKQVYIMSDARVILQLIVDNANLLDSGWTLGEVDETDVMQHTYASVKLLTVLQDLASKYSNEFWFSGPEGKIINFSKKEVVSGINLSYGSGNGLYELFRDKSDKEYFNRLTIQGGEINLPGDYGFPRLQLPLANRPYLEADSMGFDIVEKDLVLDNVYPSRIGTVSAIGGSLEIFDSSLEFDINDQLSTVDAKIAFVSGLLTGFTFVINNYDHASKKISFNLIDDDKAYPLGVPNAYLKAAVGDRYVLLDIEMPQSYIDAAEAKLLAVGQELLDEGKVDTFNYGVSLTQKWVRTNNPSINLGNLVHIIDLPMGIDVDLRIIGYTRDLQEPYRYELSVGTVAEVSQLVKEATEQSTINNAVTSSGLSAQNKPGTDTLDSVSRRGRFTSQILQPRGMVVSDLFAPPSVDPSVSEMEVGRWYIGMREAQPPGSPPVVIANLGDLLDVDASGRANDYVLFWDAGAQKYRFKAASFGPGSDVYSKTEINSFFSGATGINGYNKANWDSAFSWGNHALAGYALANGSNANGTWGINISGTAANSNQWKGNTFDGANLLHNPATYIMGYDGTNWRAATPAAIKLTLNLGSFAYRNAINGNEVGTEIASAGADIGISQMLRWKNYGNSHVIFDASAGTSPNGSAIDRKNSYTAWTETFPTLMGWNGTNTYGVRVDSAKNADLWANVAANFDTYGNSITTVIGYDASVGMAKVFRSDQLKNFLGLPATGGYDLQSVTDRGNTTSRPINIYTNSPYDWAGISQNNSATGYGHYVKSLGDIVFRVDTGVTASSIQVNGNGNVGINTGSPAYRLDVNGNGRFSDFLYVDGKLYATRTGGDGISWGTAQVEIQGTNPGIGFHYPSNYGAAMYMNSSGTLVWSGNGLYVPGNGGITADGAVTAQRIIAGYDSGVDGSVNALNWFRSIGNSGWYNSTYGGGIYMYDSDWVRVFGSKGFLVESTNGVYTTGYVRAGTGYGFQNIGYQAGRNRIWSFANADNYGLSYHQSSGSIYGKDGIGIHFGDANAPQFNFIQDGVFNATKKVTAPILQATSMFVVPKVEPATIDMPTNEWVMYVKEV